MSDKRLDNRKKITLHKSFAVLILVAILASTVVCSVMVLEMQALKSEVKSLKVQISTTGQQSDIVEMDFVDENQDFGEPTEEMNQIENQVLWDSIEQNGNVWNVDSNIRRVYLTFDDGPSSNTDKILDILDEYGVKATFFVLGKEGFSEEYQRIVKEGHTLGMHSYSHKFKEIYQSVDAYAEDLNQIHDFLYEVTGVDCKIVRFPGGSSNRASKVDMRDIIEYVSQKGLVYYDWNVSSGDASSNHVSAQQIANNVLNNVWKYDSVIILMHDSAAKPTTVEALPIIIEKILESDNTVLLPISEDTIPIQHKKQNVN